MILDIQLNVSSNVACFKGVVVRPYSWTLTCLYSTYVILLSAFQNQHHLDVDMLTSFRIARMFLNDQLHAAAYLENREGARARAEGAPLHPRRAS